MITVPRRPMRRLTPNPAGLKDTVRRVGGGDACAGNRAAFNRLPDTLTVR